MTTGSAPNTIVTFCKKCGAQLRAPAALAGKRGKCGQCGTAIQIPLKSDPAPSVAQPPAAEADAHEKPRTKSVNMVLACLVAVIVGAALAVGIYALLPSSSASLSSAPEATKPDAALAPPIPKAAAPDGRTNDSPLPTIINLVPKGMPPAKRPSPQPTPSAPTPPRRGAGPRPGFDPEPGMERGPDSSPEPGMGPGPGSDRRPSPWQRTRPGPDSGPEPGMSPGPGSDRRLSPWQRTRPGPDSGPEPGMSPGPGSDRRPGPGRRTRPGPDSGSEPGMGPGQGPGVRPGPDAPPDQP